MFSSLYISRMDGAACMQFSTNAVIHVHSVDVLFNEWVVEFSAILVNATRIPVGVEGGG